MFENKIKISLHGPIIKIFLYFTPMYMYWVLSTVVFSLGDDISNFTNTPIGQFISISILNTFLQVNLSFVTLIFNIRVSKRKEKIMLFMIIMTHLSFSLSLVGARISFLSPAYTYTQALTIGFSRNIVSKFYSRNQLFHPRFDVRLNGHVWLEFRILNEMFGENFNEMFDKTFAWHP